MTRKAIAVRDRLVDVAQDAGATIRELTDENERLRSALQAVLDGLHVSSSPFASQDYVLKSAIKKVRAAMKVKP